MPDRTCSMDGCERPIHGRKLCSTHYKRWRRSHGANPCSIEGCGKPAIGRGWCNRHYASWHRTGDPGPAVRDVGYAAIHYRLRTWHGDASTHQCRNCGAQADEWAYDHLDPAERCGPDGWPFSFDLKHYMPLCKTCHTNFDRKPKVRD